MRTLLVLNPAAGQRNWNGARQRRLLACLKRAGVDAQIHLTTSNGTGRPLGVSDWDLIIAAGGDGTVHHLLPEVARCDVPLAILPLGTANVLAREIGIPSTLEAAVAATAQGLARPVRLAEANGRLFLMSAGVGVDADLLRRVKRPLKKRLGTGAFWLSGVGQFVGYSFPTFQVTADGETFEASFAVFSRTRMYANGLPLAPNGELREPDLYMSLFTSHSRWRYLRYFTAAARGTHTRLPDVVHRRIERAEIRGGSEIGYQVDGELAGSIPLTVGLSDYWVRLVMPEQP